MNEFEPYMDDPKLSVVKFGGESVLHAENVRDRMEENEHRRLAVVSALGKVSVEDAVELEYPEGIHVEKVTDQLRRFKVNGDEELLEDILSQHTYEARRLKLFEGDEERQDALIHSFRSDLIGHFERGEKADVELMGEIMSAKLTAEYLGDGYEFIDCRKVVFFESLNPDPRGNHKIDLHRTSEALREAMSDTSKRYIMAGYGGTYEDETYLLQRSGTDVIGAAAAVAMGASTYEVFKEKKGVYYTNPDAMEEIDIKLTDDDIIKRMTYDEARDYGVAGAEVLQMDAIRYLWDKGDPNVQVRDITTIIRSASEPIDGHPGTEIVPWRPSEKTELLKCFNVQDSYVYFKIHNYGMNNIPGFGDRLLDVLNRFGVQTADDETAKSAVAVVEQDPDDEDFPEIDMKGISWDHIPTGSDSISIVLPSDQFSQYSDEEDKSELVDFYELIQEIKRHKFYVESSKLVGSVHLIGQEHDTPIRNAAIVELIGKTLRKSGIGISAGIIQFNASSSTWFIPPMAKDRARAAVHEVFFVEGMKALS